jgi:hypothetical protein
MPLVWGHVKIIPYQKNYLRRCAMYVKLYDLIVHSYYTWCFSFEDIQSDLMDILNLLIRDGISTIVVDLGSKKVINITEHDLNDVVDYLEPYVIDILQEIKY